MRAFEYDCHFQEYPGRLEAGFPYVGLFVVHFLPVVYSQGFECLLSTQASKRYFMHTNTATKISTPEKRNQSLRQWAYSLQLSG